MSILIGVIVDTEDDGTVTMNYAWQTESEPSVLEKQVSDLLITAIRDKINKISLEVLLEGGSSTGLHETGVTDTRNCIP